MSAYILVLEDDPVLGQIAVKTAKGFNFEVVLDANGNQYAETFASRGAPKAIFLDLHLPYSAGADILAAFRADARLKDAPIFVMTADILQARKLEEEGYSVFVKPVSVARLQKIFSQLQDGA